MKLFGSICLLTFSTCCVALQSQIPFGHTEDNFEQREPVRVAIIGAGAAGSSAAYHLQEYAEAQELAIDISIYEKSPYIGGRSTTVDVFDDPLYPIELGASIFVRVNEILFNASQAFGLDLDEALGEQDPGSKFDVGVWDGKQYLYRSPAGGLKWWDMAKLFWRYGLAPLRTQRLMNSTVSAFLQMYQQPLFPWNSLSEAVEQVGLLDFTSSTGEQALKNNGISEKWAREIVQSSTRVNYGQNLVSIHGLETMVCMATDDAMSVRGGNWQIFDQMVKASKANILLNTTVGGIEQNVDDEGRTTYAISTTTDSKLSESEYDIIILAAPHQFANISTTSSKDSSTSVLKHMPDKIPYVDLHVTLLATPNRLSPSFFNIDTTALLDSDAQSLVPSMVITTLPSTSQKTAKDLGPDGVGPSGFWSVNHLRLIPSTHPSNPSDQDLHVYKIFSPTPMNATFVSRLFNIPYTTTATSSSSAEFESGNDDDPLTSLPTAYLPWHFTKTWQSYPYLFPRVTFEPLRLDIDDGQGGKGGEAEVMGSFWYTSGMESFISTMETSALMGKNVAALITRGLVAARESGQQGQRGGRVRNASEEIMGVV